MGSLLDLSVAIFTGLLVWSVWDCDRLTVWFGLWCWCVGWYAWLVVSLSLGAVPEF